MTDDNSSQEGNGGGFKPIQYIRRRMREDKGIVASVEKDFILGMGFGLTVAMQALAGLVVIGGAVGIGAFVIDPGQAASLINPDATVERSTFLLSLTAWLACVMIGASIAYYFLHNLGRLIGTVGQGDPFVPENVRRLWRMSWAALGFQLISLPIGLLTGFVEPLLALENATLGDVKFNLTGLLAVFVLFILTRVFQRGVEMREDLEGTV